jgi:hypothetical protein
MPSSTRARRKFLTTFCNWIMGRDYRRGGAVAPEY